jgi:hypothetical protein
MDTSFCFFEKLKTEMVYGKNFAITTITPKDGKYFPFSQYVADTTFMKYGKPHKLSFHHSKATYLIFIISKFFDRKNSFSR